MRINPITTTANLYSIKKQTNSSLKDKSSINQYTAASGRLPVSYPMISFKGIQNSTLDLVKQIPLEDRLAYLFENFKKGDLILTGSKINDIKKGMYESAELVKDIIKRAFYLPDDKIGGNLAFIKNELNDIEVINLNAFPIDIIADKKSESLPPKDNFYVIEGDVLSVNGNLLKIKNKPKTDLKQFSKSFSQMYDFETEILPEIQKLNRKSISQLSKDAKKPSSHVTFADVGGQDKLIDELKKNILYPIRFPQGYENIDVNHGFILHGPPGTGKTHIARALANETGANFISLNGLDLESKWVGESESNWRNLFADAKSNQPSIIFIDEFDAVARSRSSHDEYGNKVVDQILTLMTDIDNEADNVFVIGATNNFKALDSAIIRSGRFGKHLEVGLPDLEGTKQIFKIQSSKKPIDKNVPIDDICKQLHDLKTSGADIRYIINEAHSEGYTRAGIFNKMENNTLNSKDIGEFSITKDDFDKAIDKFISSRNATKRNPIGYRNNN